MSKIKTVVASALIASTIVTTGCASGLSRMESLEYSKMKANDMLIEEKKPVAGAVLGILPGGGSFYSGHPGLGVVNFLFWPMSIFWDPISGYAGSKAHNYDVSKFEIKKKMAGEIRSLDDRLVSGEFDHSAYIIEKNKIEDKYRFH